MTSEALPGPEPQFDELIHPSTRLSIVALLASAEWIDFAFVRDRLELSDSALSKQFATLEDAGYIVIERPVTNRRRRVRVRLTEHGAEAIDSGYWPLAPLANTDGWIVVTANSEGLPAGSEVVIRPWP